MLFWSKEKGTKGLRFQRESRQLTVMGKSKRMVNKFLLATQKQWDTGGNRLCYISSCLSHMGSFIGTKVIMLRVSLPEAVFFLFLSEFL